MPPRNNGKRRLKVIEESTISRPVARIILPVPWRDWDRVKNRIGRCKAMVDKWGIAGSFSFGVSTSIFGVALISSIDSVVWGRQVFYWVIVLVTILLGLICQRVSKEFRRHQHMEIDTVLEDMEALESKYKRPRRG
ncbi:MAG: hypothetical protein HY662_02810 [Chloroflexi bacterium]|nr:hypothetical protein [Chloroflexota bacterium]